MEQAKIALFIDVEDLVDALRTIYNRDLDPATLLEKARPYGLIDRASAYGDFGRLPAELRQHLAALGIRTIQVDPVEAPSWSRSEGRRDPRKLAILADVFETLLDAGDIETLLFATGDGLIARAAGLARNKFGRRVVICGVRGAIAPELRFIADVLDPIEAELRTPERGELIAAVLGVMENLERRKRYLNFKFIRQHLINDESLPIATQEDADALLSEAIDCGLIVKRKIEDKYQSGQFFTAYTLNRHNALYKSLREPEAEPLASERGFDSERAAPTRSAPRPGRGQDIRSAPRFGGRSLEGRPSDLSPL